MPNPIEGGIRCMGGDPKEWSKRCRQYKSALIKRDFKDRYSGSFVGDFHAVVEYGGVYSYFPSPEPKIRIYYEWLPLAFIAKTLGGEFIVIGDEEDSEAIKNMDDLRPLTAETIEKIHTATCGGLIGSKKAVDLFLQLD
jgi:fructose-1,6-bisphosphatase